MTTPNNMPARLTRRPYQLTSHATRRAVDMALTADQVFSLIYEPDVTTEQDRTSKYYGSGTVLHMRGEHTAVLDPQRRTVVTFLYRWREGWEDHAEQLGEGREVRADSHLPSRRSSSAA